MDGAYSTNVLYSANLSPGIPSRKFEDNIVAYMAVAMQRSWHGLLSGQRLGKHVPAATVTHVVCAVCVEEFWKEENWGNQSNELCTGGYEDRTWVREAEGSPLLEAVTRERLVKTQPARKRLSGCCGDLWTVEISDGAVIACSSESCV
jgi:hypothetical protein